jgi:polysaccharide chain length determinant protein (PEP-CTERM system associated)
MELNDYSDILRRRKWHVIFSFLFILFGAFVYGVLAPELYKSTTTILVVPQRVPEGYVRSTVSVRIEDRLNTIQQQVMSRTRLTSVMDELGMFKGERKKGPTEQIVEGMRKSIQIQLASGERSRGSDAFTLTFIHENPQMAMLAASRLASFFIDENLKTREQQAVGTSEFLDSQLQETKAKLEAQEEKVKQYKLRFMGELPQQLQANLDRLSRLQDQLRTNSDSLRSAQDRRGMLEAQIKSLEALRAAASRAGTEESAMEILVDPSDPAASLITDLNARRSQLASISSRYTEQYPEIRRLKDEIAQLEKRIAEIQKAAPEEAENIANRGGGRGRASVMGTTPVYREREEMRLLRNQLTGVDGEIRSLRGEREQIQKTIVAIDARVDKSPRREQEMIALTRDYENLKIQYDALLKNKLDADVSQNLEKRQKGEQFQILDPANLPQKPFTPNRPRIFGIALMAAFLIGFGGAIGLEMLDPTLRGTRDFKHFFDFPILGSIPLFQDEQHGRKIWTRRVAIMGGLVFFTATASVFLLIYGEKVRSILQRGMW